MIELSNQAKKIVEQLVEFNHKDFEKWYDNRVKVVGSKFVMDYLLESEKKDGKNK